jgi:hypothetical protein
LLSKRNSTFLNAADLRLGSLSPMGSIIEKDDYQFEATATTHPLNYKLPWDKDSIPLSILLAL